MQLVPAVMDLLAADHDEENVGTLEADPAGDLHEQVEAADRLQPASDEGDNPRALWKRYLADPSGCGTGAVKLGVDTVEVNLDLGMKPRGKRLLLPVRGRVAGVAIDQRGQRRGVDAPGEEG